MPEPFKQYEISPLNDKRQHQTHRDSKARACSLPRQGHDQSNVKQTDNDNHVDEPRQETRTESRDAINQRHFLGGDDLVKHED